jgi:hypothetical protein
LSKASLSPLAIFFALILLFSFPGNAKAEETLIPDPNLEAAIRLQLNLLQKPLEKADLLKLTSLYPQDSSKKIKNLEGLQYSENLGSLFLPGHDIQQLEPLQNMKSLGFLALDGNQISNIEPLRNNINLSRLVISGNQIENIEPLSDLKNLTDLLMGNNHVKDISALKGLPITWLDLTQNQIEDLSPLSQVPSLQTLFVAQNKIASIDVLLDLANLKEVHMEGNPLDEHAASVITALKDKGVKVQSAKEEETTAKEIRVILDANPVPFSAPPFITNSTTLVQFRPIFERLGLQITWKEGTRTIIGQKKGVDIQLQIDNPVATVNGKSVTLPVAPTLVNGNTFVPLRFVSESVDATVEWIDDDRTVIIDSKKEFTTKDGKFHFSAYGLWRDVADEIQPDEAQLAIRFFNFTYLFIYSEPKSSDLKSMKLSQYLDKTKQDSAITEETIIEQKQTKVLGFDALQLTYVNNDDWDKRIDTVVVFESDSHFYTIVNSSYEVTYKRSIKEFQQILDNMTFHET